MFSKRLSNSKGRFVSFTKDIIIAIRLLITLFTVLTVVAVCAAFYIFLFSKISSIPASELINSAKNLCIIVCSLIGLLGIASTGVISFIYNQHFTLRIKRLQAELERLALISSETDKFIGPTTDQIDSLSCKIKLLSEELALLRGKVLLNTQKDSYSRMLKNNLLTRLSHEIRNPLHGIMGINALILKRKDSMPIWDLVKMGDYAAEGLLSIVEEIIDFSKAEDGTLLVDQVPFEPVQMVRESMQAIISRLEAKYSYGDNQRLDLVVDIDSSVPFKVKGDPQKLKKIITSLLGNAIKFTPSGHVGIRLTSCSINSKLNLVIEIWDTGIGIAPNDLDILINHYNSLQEPSKSSDRGTGLGVLIAKKFTECMGGSLSAESKVNQGSTFKILLPVEVVEHSRPKKILALQKPLPKDAIILGQNSPMTDTLRKNLTQRGIQVRQYNLIDQYALVQVERHLLKADLLVVMEDSLTVSKILPVLRARSIEHKKCTITAISPSSIRLRDNLSEIGLKQTVNWPIFIDDVIGIYGGQSPEIVIREALGTPILDFDRKLKVIVADDMPPNRFILQEMLEEAGHQVVCVNDGKDILDRISPMLYGDLRSEIFDLVITDITMTNMDGDEVTRNIRAIEKERLLKTHIPIIAVTGHIFEEERARIKSSGVDGILQKPMNKASLSKELWKIFQQ